VRINIYKYGYQMVFESPNCSFGSINPMFVRGNQLVSDIVLGERFFEVGGALVIEDVQLWCMTLVN
jgi:hypothetical protein